MGLSRFLRFQLRLCVVDLPDTISIENVRQLVHDDNTKQEWESYRKEIEDDNQAFTSFFSADLFPNEGVAKDVFALHVCEELSYYIYCYAQYQRCCHSKWQYWRQVFLANNKLTGTNLIFTSCNKQHNCHLQLTPYFYDNKTLQEFLASHTDTYTTELKDMLRLAKTNNDKEGMFAYKEDFNEGCDEWNENIWTKRLGACIGKYVVKSSYKIKYTADQGNRIYNNQLLYHRFHGAPDLTIFESDNERGVAIATTSEGSGSADNDSDSQGTTIGAVEDSVQIEGKFKDLRLNMTILEKTGELIANMHIMLVDKMLKANRIGDFSLQSLTVDGILISRSSGITICKYVMPVQWFGEGPTTAELTLQSKVTPVLPENICVSIRALLEQ